jgi:hypothetical protein
MTPLRIARLFANSDQALFNHCLSEAGLAIVGKRGRDPLRKNVQPSTILAMASAMTEDIHDLVELTPHQRALRTIAEQAGYVVALAEGLNQMPGTLPTPIRSLLRAEPEPPPEQGGEEGGGGGEDEEGGDMNVQMDQNAPPPPSGGGGGGAPPPMPPPGGGGGGLPVV